MKILGIAMIGSALVMSGAAAATEPSHATPPANADQYYGFYRNPSQAVAPSGADSGDFVHSGTRGRDDLGAGAFNPEGPGNVAD